MYIYKVDACNVGQGVLQVTFSKISELPVKYVINTALLLLVYSILHFSCFEAHVYNII